MVALFKGRAKVKRVIRLSLREFGAYEADRKFGRRKVSGLSASYC